jgi:hypothetical protein
MAILSEIRIPRLGAEPRPAEVWHVSPRPWQMEGVACTAVRVRDRAQSKGWRGRGVRAGSTDGILPRRWRSEGGRVNC